MPTSPNARGKTITVLVADQAVDFKTFAIGSFERTFIYDHTLVESQPFQDDPLLGVDRTNNRDATTPADGLPNLAGKMTVPLDFNHVGLWLKGAFGAAVVSGSGDPYSHTWKSGNEALPFRSIEVEVMAPTQNYFMQYTGVMVDKLAISASRAPGDQKISLDLVGRNETKAIATAGGSPAAAWARDPAPAAISTLKLDDVAVADVLSINATYSNMLKGQDFLGDKYVSGYDLDQEATFAGDVLVRFRDSGHYDDAVNNTARKAEILFSKSSNRSLSIVAHTMRLEKSGLPISGPGGIQQKFNFRAEQSASSEMLTVVLKSLVPVY